MRTGSPASVFVLSTGQATVAILRRIRRTGFEVAGVSESPEVVLRECEAGRCTLLVVIVEPSMLTRMLMRRCDELGVRVVGVVSNPRHREWAALLPLCETVWLFAPARLYHRLLLGYQRVPERGIAS